MSTGYQVSHANAATAATLAHVFSQLWNPHASIRMAVNEIHIANTTAVVSNIGILRSTARGTAASTITPSIDSSRSRQVIPPSGALLDAGVFSAQPTLAGSTIFLERTILPATIGAAIFFSFPLDDPLVIPPGTGIVLVTSLAAVTAATVTTFAWRE